MAWSLIEEIEKYEGTMSVAEAARLIGCRPRKVYRMIASKQIPTVDMGDSTTAAKIIDPKTWVYVLLKRNPMVREASKKG